MDIREMVDKNPEKIFNDELIDVISGCSNKNPIIILCTDPLSKTEFLSELINSSTYPVIFLDFDLLYSGYVISGMIQKNQKVQIYHPNKKNWTENLSEIIRNISNKKFLVIIDSLNGLYNLFEEKESSRSINASLMFLASIGRESESSMIITALARKKDNKEWILSPGGRHVINSRKSGLYYLGKKCWIS